MFVVIRRTDKSIHFQFHCIVIRFLLKTTDLIAYKVRDKGRGSEVEKCLLHVL